MPGTILKKMLASLCSSGAVFCHPDYRETGESRGEDSSVFRSESAKDFEKNIPGDKRFHPEAKGSHPYYPPERHPGHIEIIFPIQGIVDFQINGVWHLLKENKVHILLPGTLHTERHFQEKPYTLFWVTSLPSSLTLHRTEYSPESGYGQSACRVVIAPPMARPLWECGSGKELDEPHYFSLLLQCLDYAVMMNQAQQRTMDYHNAVSAQIKEYLDENFRKKISLKELADMAHFSAIHLNFIFRKQYGISLHKYLIQLRLQEAMQLLKAGMTPGETARRTGFQDQRYFSRIFRRHTGVVPSQYPESPEKSFRVSAESSGLRHKDS